MLSKRRKKIYDRRNLQWKNINHTFLALLFALVGGATRLGRKPPKTRLILQQPTGYEGGEEERTSITSPQPSVFSPKKFKWGTSGQDCTRQRNSKHPTHAIALYPTPKRPSFFQDWSGSKAQRRYLGPAGSPIAFIYSSWVGNAVALSLLLRDLRIPTMPYKGRLCFWAWDRGFPQGFLSLSYAEQMEDVTVMTTPPPRSVFLSLSSSKLFSGHLHQQPIKILKKSY